MLSKMRNQKGFTLIELLIVVAIIGILAAIAIPNLLTAMQRSKQKRTMADMRSVATAWEARATDFNRYNAAGYTLPAEDVTGVINEHLAPTYIRTFPNNDAWSNPFQLYTTAAVGNATAAQRYAVVSYGRDQADSGIQTGATTDFDCDIIYENGTFIAWPEGVQSGN